MEDEFLYRYEEQITAPLLDEYDEVIAGTRTMRLVCYEFKINKRTPKGVWIDTYGFPKFVNMNARKRYAWPTREEAYTSFRARKERQIEIVSYQLRRARCALKVDPAKALQVKHFRSPGISEQPLDSSSE